MSHQTATRPDQRTARPRRRRLAFVILAMGLGLLSVVLLEVALWSLGVAAQVEYQDPLVGFSQISPLFELDADDEVYRTNRSRLTMFHEQEFVAVKPENGIRVFCLGGSTVRGHPYETPTAFARWMELELAQRDPTRAVEVVNCGGLSYASYRLLNLLKEVLAYQPDLIVVATGHNEFLEDRTYDNLKARSDSRAWLDDHLQQLRMVRLLRNWTRTKADASASLDASRSELPDEVDARLDHHTGYASYHRNDAWSRGVVEHFDRSIRAMVALCRQTEVPLILVELGSNIRDCPPFKSEHRADLSAEDQLEWERLFDEATRLDQRDLTQALAVYQQAAAIDADYALLAFRMARLLDELGRVEEAREMYLKAKDADICPLRMTEEMAGRLNEIANETQTPLIPARQMIEGHIDSQMAGNDWYLDHVHPIIPAHQMIARSVVEEMQGHTIIGSLAPWSQTDRRRAYHSHFASLGPLYLREGTERLMWLENWARRERLADETRPRDPQGHLRLGWRLWDLGQQDVALIHLTRALDDQPRLGAEVYDRALLLFQQGRGPEAVELLQWLADRPERGQDAGLIAALIDLIDQDLAGADARALLESLTPLAGESPEIIDRWREAVTN